MDCISIVQDKSLRYPLTTPFHPSETLSGIPWKDYIKKPYLVYGAVRKLLVDLGLDAEHSRKPDRILSKNWSNLGYVLSNPISCSIFHPKGWDWESIITHTSVVRPSWTMSSLLWMVG